MDLAPTRRRFLRAAGGFASGALLLGNGRRTAAAGDEAWPRSGYDAANTGYAPDNTEVVGDLRETWRLDGVFHSPVVAGGTVFASVDDESGAYVSAIDAASGTETWRFDLDRGSAGTPAVVDGRLYFCDSSGTIRILDSSDGAEEGRIRMEDDDVHPVVPVDGTVYTTSGSSLYALDAEAGGNNRRERVERWAFDTGDDVRYLTPSVADDTVYVGNESGRVYAVAASDGSEQWAFEADDRVRSSPAVADGVVYFGCDDASLYALDASDGTETWRFETNAAIRSSPVVAGGTVFAFNAAFTLYAVDTESGDERWSNEIQGATSSPAGSERPTAVGDTVYVSQQFSTVYSGDAEYTGAAMYGFDADDGSQRWAFDAGSATSSLIVAGGAIYAVVNDSLHAFAGETVTPTPSSASTQSPTPTDAPSSSTGTATSTPTRTDPDAVTDTARPTRSPTDAGTLTPVSAGAGPSRSTPTATAVTETAEASESGGTSLLPLGLGVAGLGGGAALYYLRRGDGETDEPTPDELQTSAAGAVTKGDQKRDEGAYQRAIERYQRAIDRYEAADRAVGSAEAGDRAAAIATGLAEAREKLAETRERLAQLNAVRDPLRDAECSLQTAVSEHARNQRTAARRDYRQAGEQYEQALEALADGDSDVFEREGEITVSVTVETVHLPRKLVGWPYLSDGERDALSAAGIGTVADLRDVGDDAISDLVERGAIDEELAARLRAAAWWHGADERTFTSREAIARQRDRARDGFRMLR